MDYLAIARQALHKQHTRELRQGEDKIPCPNPQGEDKIPRPDKELHADRPTPHLETEKLWKHVAVLLPIVQEACRRGYHQGIDQVSGDVIASLRVALDPARDPTEFDTRARLAGTTATLAAVVQQLEERLQLLAERGDDTFWPAAELALALAYIPPAQTAPPQTVPPQTVPPQTVPPQTVPPQTVPPRNPTRPP